VVKGIKKKTQKGTRERQTEEGSEVKGSAAYNSFIRSLLFVVYCLLFGVWVVCLGTLFLKCV